MEVVVAPFVKIVNWLNFADTVRLEIIKIQDNVNHNLNNITLPKDFVRALDIVELNLQCGTLIDHDLFVIGHNMVNLRSLNISGNKFITNSGIFVLVNQRCVNIETLDVSNIPLLSYFSHIAISKYLPILFSIKFKSDDRLKIDLVFLVYYHYFQSITWIDLLECHLEGDSTGVSKLYDDGPPDFFRKDDDVSIELQQNEWEPMLINHNKLLLMMFKKSPSLRGVCFHSVDNTNIFEHHVFDSLNNLCIRGTRLLNKQFLNLCCHGSLVEIVLYDVKNITSKCIVKAVTICCNTLRTFECYDCITIGDIAVVHVTTRCKQLTKLTIVKCAMSERILLYLLRLRASVDLLLDYSFFLKVRRMVMIDGSTTCSYPLKTLGFAKKNVVKTNKSNHCIIILFIFQK